MANNRRGVIVHRAHWKGVYATPEANHSNILRLKNSKGGETREGRSFKRTAPPERGKESTNTLLQLPVSSNDAAVAMARANPPILHAMASATETTETHSLMAGAAKYRRKKVQ